MWPAFTYLYVSVCMSDLEGVNRTEGVALLARQTAGFEVVDVNEE